MAKNLKVGDYVTWNSEAGHVGGTIIKSTARTLPTKAARIARTNFTAKTGTA